MDSASIHERLRAILRASPAVALAILFGSSARGTENPDSDVDLALRLDASGSREHNRLIADLERAGGREIDVVLIDEAPPLLRFEIARDGVVLIERHPHAWADFRAKAMLDWWDFAPYAARFAEASVERLRTEVRRGAA